MVSENNFDKDFLIKKVRVPRFVYGTAWKEDKTADYIINALTAGFNGIDTANQRKHYFEAQVGDALQQALESGRLKREELFIQTKFTCRQGQDHRLPYDENAEPRFQVEQSFASSLSHLSVDYIDAYLLHGLEYAEGITAMDIDVWRAMEQLFRTKKVKLLGVCNISKSQLVELCRHAKIKPSFVQNRCFARAGWDKAIRKVCQRQGIIYQGFSLLTANTEILGLPAFQSMIHRSGLTAAQLVFQAAQTLGMVTLTGTTCVDHMKEDLSCHRQLLTAEDVKVFEHLLYEES